MFKGLKIPGRVKKTMHHIIVLHIINRYMKTNFTLGIIYMRQGQYGIMQKT